MVCDQLEKNDRIMKCKICGYDVPNGVDICPRCKSNLKMTKKGAAVKICPQCGKRFVDGSLNCKRCGSYLINEKKKASTPFNFLNEVIDGVREDSMRVEGQVGKQVINSGGNAAVNCYCASLEPYQSLDSDSVMKVNILLHEHGLKIVSGTYTELELISEKQIISIKQEVTTVQKDKSVIGRGVAGGLLLGPVGAIVGGMSGIGQKNTNVYILYIAYSVRKNEEPKVAVFASTKPFDPLIRGINSTLKIGAPIKPQPKEIVREKVFGKKEENLKRKETQDSADNGAESKEISCKKSEQNTEIKQEETKPNESEIISKLKEYKKLLDDDIISKDEFEYLKNKLLK